MRAAERVARIPKIDVDSITPALSGSKERVQVNEWKAKRLDAEQAQNTEIERARPPVPQRPQRSIK